MHFCLFPEAAVDALDERVEASVARMQTVIETGRQIRERNNKPLKTPLKRMIVAHDDLDFLADLQGELRDYVVDELNVRELEVCDDLSSMRPSRLNQTLLFWVSVSARRWAQWARV